MASIFHAVTLFLAGQPLPASSNPSDFVASARAATCSSMPSTCLNLTARTCGGSPSRRKATLARLLRGCLPGFRFNEHLAHSGELVFHHACAMGLEGIVSKRLGSRYRAGRTDPLRFL